MSNEILAWHVYPAVDHKHIVDDGYLRSFRDQKKRIRFVKTYFDEEEVFEEEVYIEILVLDRISIKFVKYWMNSDGLVLSNREFAELDYSWSNFNVLP